MVIRGKEIKNLIVGGCSYSSYTELDLNYGTYLSDMFGFKNIDGYNAGCGSNHRIWRKIVTDLRNHKITPSDLLVIQYTTKERREFWSRHHNDTNFNVGHPIKGTPMREDYHYGQLIKFKFNMVGEGMPREEKELFQLWEKNFICGEYESEIFDNTHFMLVKTLDSLGINAIFLGTQYQHDIDLWGSKFCSYISIREDIDGDLDYCLNGDDCYHLSEKGHYRVAQILGEHIKEICIQ